MHSIWTNSEGFVGTEEEHSFSKLMNNNSHNNCLEVRVKREHPQGFLVAISLIIYDKGNQKKTSAISESDIYSVRRQVHRRKGE